MSLRATQGPKFSWIATVVCAIIPATPAVTARAIMACAVTAGAAWKRRTRPWSEEEGITVVGVLYLSVITLVLWAVIVIFHYPGVYSRLQARRPLERVIYFAQAHMAQELCPLMDKCVTEDSIILIPGGDPNELFRRFYPWPKYLNKWLKQGASITYYLVEPRRRSIEALKELENKHPGLKLCVVSSANTVEDDGDRELLESMKTFHTVLLTNEAGDRRMIWIEGDHPAGSKVAYDCEFVPPAVVKREKKYYEKFDEYWEKLKYVENNFCEKCIT